MCFGVVGAGGGKLALKVGQQPLIEQGARQPKAVIACAKLVNDPLIGGGGFVIAPQATQRGHQSHGGIGGVIGQAEILVDLNCFLVLIQGGGWFCGAQRLRCDA